MESVDAVILAAGRGSRLDGLAAPFHKPLLPIDGVPLITRAVDVALRKCTGHIIVVVSPENALPISQVLGDRNVHMIVQRTPRGPGAALLCGIVATNADHALVLLADNVISDSDVEKVVACSGIGVRHMSDAAAAERFSRYDWSAPGWVERVPVTDDQRDDSDRITVWVGPMVVSTVAAATVLNRHRGDGELLLGPYLSQILASWTMVAVDSHDVGEVRSYVERSQ